MATHVYVIKVRSPSTPRSQLLPSERRYSAKGVLGLACIHFALASLAIILALLRNRTLGHGFWPFVFVPLTSIASGITGLLAWRRWYESIYIRIFLVVSLVTFLTCISVGLVDIFTAADFQISAELHAVMTSLVAALWSAISTWIAWRGMRNKKTDDNVTPPSIAHAWSQGNDGKGQTKVLEYLRKHSRPPVEGKEKGDEVTSENSS